MYHGAGALWQPFRGWAAVISLDQLEKGLNLRCPSSQRYWMDEALSGACREYSLLGFDLLGKLGQITRSFPPATNRLVSGDNFSQWLL